MSDILSKIKNVETISRTLDLGDCDEAYRGAVFEVWVAPTRAHLQEWRALTEYITDVQKRADGMSDDEKDEALVVWHDRQLAWYAGTWLNIGLDEARQIRDALPDVVWDWLTINTSRMIGQYRTEKLKNSNGG